MGMSLAAITNDSNLAVFNNISVYILIIENFCHSNLPFSKNKIKNLYKKYIKGTQR